MRRSAGLVLVGGLMVLSLCGAAAEPPPVMFQSAQGRFEVAAVDPLAGQRLAALATEAWFHLAAPLRLPNAFSSSVLVRVIPAADWSEVAPFRVIVEAGGVVSVRLRWGPDTPELFMRRALVQGLLMRLAVSRHGVTARLSAPLWLEQAGVGWWRTRAEPALLDAVKQASAGRPPPELARLLDWSRGEAEPAALVDDALWWWTFLQNESGRGDLWPALLHRLLGGEEPAAALAATYRSRFSSVAERELWWQTGWHQLRRARVLPVLEASESRAELATLMRFVAVQIGVERVLPLREMLAHAREPEVEAEVKSRQTALARILPIVHPFYRNAALSLAEAFALRPGEAARSDAAAAAFEGDWRDAGELEAAARAALDALERTLRTSR